MNTDLHELDQKDFMQKWVSSAFCWSWGVTEVKVMPANNADMESRWRVTSAMWYPANVCISLVHDMKTNYCMQHQWELVVAQTFAVFRHVQQPVTFCDKWNARVCEVIGRDSIVQLWKNESRNWLYKINNHSAFFILTQLLITLLKMWATTLLYFGIINLDNIVSKANKKKCLYYH